MNLASGDEEKGIRITVVVYVPGKRRRKIEWKRGGDRGRRVGGGGGMGGGRGGGGQEGDSNRQTAVCTRLQGRKASSQLGLNEEKNKSFFI
jgi:hypothetical protein